MDGKKILGLLKIDLKPVARSNKHYLEIYGSILFDLIWINKIRVISCIYSRIYYDV